jgi:tetratricopeptide (TPR) repeat protein
VEEAKKQLLAEAHGCEKRGDNKGAGDAFARAGAHEDAARAYLAGGHFAEAGQTLVRIADYDIAHAKPAESDQKGPLLKAAICFSRAGDVGRAVQLFLAIGDRGRAVELLQSVGDMVTAARVEADWSGHIDLSKYTSPNARDLDGELQAARRLESTGKREAAMEAYACLKLWADAARLARVLGKPDRAAGYYTDASMPFEAAECYLICRDVDQALTNLYQVEPTHPRYRDACFEAIRTCADHSILTFDLEHLVEQFQATGPISEKEVEAFYALALLFESHQSFDNAAVCYQKLLNKHPHFRDAEARLHASLDEDRGASSKDFARIVREEQAVRDAVRRHTTSGMHQGSNVNDPMPDLPNLPDLPDLPDLPSLPEVPRRPPVGTRHVEMSASQPAESGLLKNDVVIAGRYRLEKKIGQGGMGTVWKAYDRELDEVIAIKFLSCGLVDDEVIGRFKQEVSLSRHFNHPNIIRLYDLGSYGDNRYITMELLEGQDLGSILKAGLLPLATAIEILIQACHALQIVHDHGVVHRDVKPDNFFLTTNGVLKVMDFGIAKRQQASKGLTQQGTMAGTPQFIAPEQTSDFANVTHLADIYALGCIAYKMFTGRVPFDGDDIMPILIAHVSQAPAPPRSLNPAIPEDVEAVVLQLLAKQPEHRVQSCRDLAMLLSGLRDRLA